MEQDNYSISWKDLPWEKFQKKSFRLQCKIYEAKQKGDCKQVKRFQKLLVASKSTHYIAVRRILIQLSVGEKRKENFPLSHTDILKLAEGMTDVLYSWKKIPDKTKTSTDSSDEDKVLFLSNLRVKVIDCICSMALEPVSQVMLFKNYASFNFNHHSWDIQRGVCSNLATLSNVLDKVYLEATFPEPSFSNNLNILTRLVTSGLRLISNDRLANYFLSGNKFNSTLGLRTFLKKTLLRGILEVDQELETKLSNVQDCLVSNFIYNYDFLYIFTRGSNLHPLLHKIADFFRVQGLHLNYETIKFSFISRGTTCLKWYFRLQNKRTWISYPHLRDWDTYKKIVKFTLHNSRYSLPLRVEKLVFLTRKWYALHRFSSMCIMKGKLYYLKVWLGRAIRRMSNVPKNVAKIYLNLIFSRI